MDKTSFHLDKAGAEVQIRQGRESQEWMEADQVGRKEEEIGGRLVGWVGI